MQKKKSLRKKHCARRKKSFFENNIIYGGLFLLFLFFSGIYLFLFYPFFQIKSVSIGKYENIDEEKLTDYINKKAERKFLFLTSKSIFLFSETKIRNDVLSEVSVIKNISAEKVFPGEIKISLIERVPVAIWCRDYNTKHCYYIDKEGIAFQKINDIKKGLILIIKEKEYFLGEVVVSEDYINKIFFLINEFRKINTSLNHINLGKEDTIELITKEGWSVLFSIENNENELKNLKLILEKLGDDKIKNLDYIDLRFGDRIYYK